MFSLFRMENYRFVRTRTVHVITAILIAVTILGVVISAMTMKDSAELNICQMFTKDIAPVLNMVFWGIIIAIYIYGEYKNGFIKSIGGQIPKKGMLCASKMYIMAAYTLCMYLWLHQVLLSLLVPLFCILIQPHLYKLYLKYQVLSLVLSYLLPQI